MLLLEVAAEMPGQELEARLPVLGPRAVSPQLARGSERLGFQASLDWKRVK